MTWVSSPAAGGSARGVLVLPPLGYAWWSTHRTLRVLAEALAADGHVVARLDYHGTGDSAGDQAGDGRVTAWRQSVADAVGDLRAQGCEHVSLVGVGLGGTLALIDGERLGADAIALWAPVVDGKRWARQVRLLAEAAPEDADCPAGTLSAAGVVFSTEALADIGALSATALPCAPASRVLVVDGNPHAKLVDHLTSLGVDVDARSVAGGEQALEAGAEDAVVPVDVVEAIRAWLGPAASSSSGVTPATPRTRTLMRWRGGEVEESVVRLGVAQRTAVRCAPVGGPATPGTVVFLNSGAEPHVGPGRAWVELARDLALRGHASYRVDWCGWGESPWRGSPLDRPEMPRAVGRSAAGRPYASDAVAQTIELVRDFRGEGHDDVVLCGLCASAWAALRAVLEVDVAGVVAMNPQLYLEPGDRFWNTMPDARRGRAQEIAELHAGAASGRWDAEDRTGDHPPAARWLDRLAAVATPVTMVFAEGDDGIEYLSLRIPRRLAEAQQRGVRVVELEGVDHAMHRMWTRPRVAEAIAAAVSRMCSPSGAQVAERLS